MSCHFENRLLWFLNTAIKDTRVESGSRDKIKRSAALDHCQIKDCIEHGGMHMTLEWKSLTELLLPSKLDRRKPLHMHSYPFVHVT